MGVYTNRAGHDEQQALLNQFFNNLRTIRCIANATLIFMPEDSLNEAINLVNGSLEQYKVIPAYLSTKNYLPGVPITNDHKVAMIEEFKGFLTKSCITFSKDLLTLTNKREYRANTDQYGVCPVHYVLKLAEEQVRRFRKEPISKRDDFEDVKFKYTGKDNGLNDDLGIAIIMVPYWSRKYDERVTQQQKKQ